MHDTLTRDLEATHDDLRERLDRASHARATPDPARPRAERPTVDQFLRTASRHNAAMLAVVLPAVRARLPEGSRKAHALVAQVRHVEVALNWIKAKEYGSTYAVRTSWDSLWEDLYTEFEALCALEEELAHELDTASSDDHPDWATALHHAELRAPSRPHPWIPHQGVAGKSARAVARRIDAFWDTSQASMLPPRPDHRDRAGEGHFSRWVLADPHLSEDGPPADQADEPRGGSSR